MAQYNFRLFLKPTVIGQAIIDRLSPEGADRQALARRWIELGYALEQAGFRLDGTTVFQGARPVSLDTLVAVPVSSPWFQPPAAEAAQRGGSVAEAPVPAHTSLPTSTTSTDMAPASSNAEPADAATVAAGPVVRSTPPAPLALPSSALDEMADSLRNLSH